MLKIYGYLYLLLAWLPVSSLSANPETDIPLRHAISLYGSPKYGPDFKHFGYANPNALKGGVIRESAEGQFDSIIPYVDKGIPAAGSYYQYDSLLQRSWDEPLTKYGLIAQYIELEPNNKWVAFHVNPSAKFNDGVPVTANDLKFSFDILREKGSTFYRHFYREVDRVEVTSRYRAVFYFNNPENRELPLILGQMPILPEHYWKSRDFGAQGVSIPVSSGPYKVDKVVPGRSITYVRDTNYWGRDLAVNRGRHNFDKIIYEYYKDSSVSREAFLNGEYDITVIDNTALKSDRFSPENLLKQGLVTTVLDNANPQTLTLTYNTRREFLKDIRVRESIGYALDFESINKNQFMGVYKRAQSFFAGTDLASSGLPDKAELQWLSPWKPQLPSIMFTKPYTAPDSRIGIGDRLKRAKALELLKRAGWRIKENRQVNKDGKSLELTAMTRSTSTELEKVMLSLKQGLKYLGIRLQIDRVDPVQYVERIREQDFDIIFHTYPHTPSPGTEQASLWGSETIEQRGTKNYTGVNSPVVDYLVKKIPEARTRAELLSVIHALDRTLLWGHYALPLWYLPTWTVVHKRSLGSPRKPAPYALDLSTWWYK